MTNLPDLMPLPVLIIGCGAIAGGFDSERAPDKLPQTHAGAIARDRRLKLVACVDPDDEVREAFAKRWNVPIAVRDVSELERPEGGWALIVIASPTEYHEQHLEWALGMKPNSVFCEKPLARDLDAARSLATQYNDAGIRLGVNYSRRWAPDIAELPKRLREEGWGDLISAVGTYSKGIVHNGGHMVDLLHMFFWKLEVHSVGQGLADFWKDDPTADALLIGSNGDEDIPVHLVASDCRHVSQFELVLNCTGGEVAIRDSGLRIESRRVEESELFPGYLKLGLPESTPSNMAGAMTAAYNNAAQTAYHAQHWLCHSGNAIRAQEICEEIREKALLNMREFE